MAAISPPTHEGEVFVPEPLTPDEVEALLAACSRRSPAGLRMRGLIAVMYGAGTRLDETLSLHVRDIDTDDGALRVRRGKGGKYRTIGIDAHAAEILQRWLDRRPALGLNGRHPVFALYSKGKVGAPMGQRQVRAALARLADKAGIDKRVHPHGLRHSLATRMAREGAHVTEIQAQLGHEWLTTTARYVQKLGAVETVGAMKRINLWGDNPAT